MAANEYEGLDRGFEVEAEGSARVRDTKDRMEGCKAFLSPSFLLIGHDIP